MLTTPWTRRPGFAVVVGAIGGAQLEALRAASDKLVAEICAQGGHSVAEPSGGGNRGWGRYSFGVASDSGSCLHVPRQLAESLCVQAEHTYQGSTLGIRAKPGI